MKPIEQLKQWLDESPNTIFLGGAGVSTASGIPDFRSAHGLYMEKKQGISYEEMLSHEYLTHHSDQFYDFLRNVMLYPDAKPNAAHYALARLEEAGKLQAVITQNIDGLHQMAGSKNVIELHGNENRYYCLSCGKQYDMSVVTGCTGTPRLRAVRYAEECALMIVAGTSLVVYPVAGLVNELSPSARLVILNRDPTPYDSRADLIFRDDLTEVLQSAT